MQILRLPAVLSKTGLTRTPLLQLISAGHFPKPVRISTRSVGWLEHEVDDWIASRVRT